MVPLLQSAVGTVSMEATQVTDERSSGGCLRRTVTREAICLQAGCLLTLHVHWLLLAAPVSPK